MIIDKIGGLLLGCFIIIFGIWLFSNSLKETRKGYKSPYGHDIGLYGGAIMAILFGAVLIWKSITSI